MICSKCEKEISNDAKFCPYCGAPAQESEQVVQAEVEEPRYDHNYTQDVYVEPKPEKANGFGIAGMILGICTLLLLWCMPASVLVGIIGIILSAISLGKPGKRGFGVAGLVMSIIGVAIAVLLLIILIALATRATFTLFSLY